MDEFGTFHKTLLQVGYSEAQCSTATEGLKLISGVFTDCQLGIIEAQGNSTNGHAKNESILHVIFLTEGMNKDNVEALFRSHVAGTPPLQTHKQMQPEAAFLEMPLEAYMEAAPALLQTAAYLQTAVPMMDQIVADIQIITHSFKTLQYIAASTGENGETHINPRHKGHSWIESREDTLTVMGLYLPLNTKEDHEYAQHLLSLLQNNLGLDVAFADTGKKNEDGTRDKDISAYVEGTAAKPGVIYLSHDTTQHWDQGVYFHYDEAHALLKSTKDYVQNAEKRDPAGVLYANAHLEDIYVTYTFNPEKLEYSATLHVPHALEPMVQTYMERTHGVHLEFHREFPRSDGVTTVVTKLEPEDRVEAVIPNPHTLSPEHRQHTDRAANQAQARTQATDIEIS